MLKDKASVTRAEIESTSESTTLPCSLGMYPFSETNFQDFSRTQNDFSRTLKFTFITISLPRSQCHYSSFFSAIHIILFTRVLTDFQNFPWPAAFFLGLSSPGKYHNKIPGLCKFFRTRAKAVFNRLERNDILSIHVSKRFIPWVFPAFVWSLGYSPSPPVERVSFLLFPSDSRPRHSPVYWLSFDSPEKWEVSFLVRFERH